LTEDHYQLPFSFAPEKLQADLRTLLQNDTLWTDHFVTANYSGSWSVIPLRANAGATHPIKMIYSDPTSKDYVDTPFLQSCPFFQEVLGNFPTTLYAVRLMRLASGSVIKEHRDHDLDLASGCVRIHIPVVTNPQLYFYLNDRRVVMNEGECWYLRLSDPHRVENQGPDRVHLVIDMAVNDWVRKVLSH